MPEHTIESDYFIVGSGAVGMAFADTLVAETDARVVIVDRHDRPGGHWNDAYPFVRLHSPANYYGVASTQLGSGRIEEQGDNAGLYELSSGREINAYYDRVMQEKLLASGRVQYFPCHEYRGDGEIVSLVSGARRNVRHACKLVDATYTITDVPSTRPPTYAIDEGVRCVPINDLVRLESPYETYTVVGGGKTGIDACLWLLDRGVPADRIRWIRPRDAWLHNRERVQSGVLGHVMVASAANQMEAAIAATSIDELFERMEASGEFMRIDQRITPTMYRGATVSPLELTRLRAIEDVVRLGRVERIQRDRIVLQEGTVPVQPNTLYVDCSASGIGQRSESRPIFEDKRLTLQVIRNLQPTLSGALIAFLESKHPDRIDGNNALAAPIAFGSQPRDWVRMMVSHIGNTFAAMQDPELRAFEARCRLNPSFGAPRKEDNPGPEWLDARRRFRESVQEGITAMQKLLAVEG